MRQASVRSPQLLSTAAAGREVHTLAFRSVPSEVQTHFSKAKGKPRYLKRPDLRYRRRLSLSRSSMTRKLENGPLTRCRGFWFYRKQWGARAAETEESPRERSAI